MYKAIKEIGGYKIGEEVPTEKALIWMDMYSEPHVELAGGKSTETKEESSDSSNPMLDDYLARNTSVVVKNINSDKLSRLQFNSLLDLEKSNKNRRDVIKAINKKLSA